MSVISKATFAAGCFWGVEVAFNKKFGSKLLSNKVGYCGGTTKNPTYKQVCTGASGHAEVVQIEFKENEVPYEDLVDFLSHDPTTLNRQGGDSGTQYRSAIFYHDQKQKEIAEKVKAKAAKYFRNVSTTLEKADDFFVAEDYHQNYLVNNPNGYHCSTHFERSWEQIAKEEGTKI
ncbi:Peptide-methionine (S)-S-oxide reductase [Clydaea vesicula]|uniref:peptide-methionine (S)-S-oxide reductase n=1 Tax=Clydaea vesicula TaxID=447962 RepID=A0AAD5TWE6_9FUNG|nr:Peptide-methionine (S)-S-oxide reductase [Clydaea vesicula]